MAGNIAAKAKLSSPLIIHNRTAKRAHDFATALESPSSVQVADTVEDAVSPADIVFTSLGDDASVRQMYETILKTPGGVDGKLFVETSTIHPETTNEINELVKAAGAKFVACPGS